MRYSLIRLAIMALLIWGIVTILPSGAAATTGLQHALNGLKADDYTVLSWRIFPDSRIKLLLLYRERPGFKRYYAYAELDYSGNFIVGPDSISRSYSMSDKATFFDDEGRLFRYDNKNGHRTSPLLRYSYDPSKGKVEFRKYESWKHGRLSSGTYISGIGNVLLSRDSESSLPWYRLLIEDLQADSFKVFELDLVKNYNGHWREICGYKLSENRILVIGMTAESLDGINSYSMVSSLVFDLNDKHLVHVQHVPIDSLIEDGAPEIGTMGPARIFEKDGKLYYLAVGISIHGGMRRNVIVSFDNDGKIISDVQALQLSVEYQSLDSAPEQFILLRAPEQSRKFWMMSLDTFPTIVIDKGE